MVLNSNIVTIRDDEVDDIAWVSLDGSKELLPYPKAKRIFGRLPSDASTLCVATQLVQLHSTIRAVTR